MATLQPAYGRDYKSKAEVVAAINRGQDFILNDRYSVWDGKPINLEGLAEYREVSVRYCQNRRLVILVRRHDGWSVISQRGHHA